MLFSPPPLTDTRRSPGTVFKVADLFSGAGGMSYGFHAHPAFKLVAAVDAQIGKPCNGVGTLECNRTYAANIGLEPLARDLAVYEPGQLLADADLRPGELDVLLSCAPCTGFSRTVNDNHLRDDPRNTLVGRTGLFVEALRPRVLVMENARELLQGNYRHHAERLCEHLRRLGYRVSAATHMLTRFGLPQRRERALLVAHADGGPVHTLDELWAGQHARRETTTVRHAIAHLPPLAAGKRDARDRWHASPGFGRLALDRLRALPHDGGSWRDLLTHPDADRLLTPAMKAYVSAGKLGSHPDIYGRMAWDKPAPTVKRECAHAGNGRYCHPDQDRLLTVREMALLNGFPTAFTFGASSLGNAYRHIGDAVPPTVSYQLAHACAWMLTGERPDLAQLALPGATLAVSDLAAVACEALF